MIKPQIVGDDAVKLMTVNGEVPQAAVLPRILLVDLYSDKVRHDVGESLVVVAFHPDDFNISLGVGELADVAEELPVFLGKTAEVEVGENVAEQDETRKTMLLQHPRGIPGAAAVRAQMQVGEDQRVIDGRIHAPFLVHSCYGMMKG